MKILVIDNYDSFTYNIVQTIAANALADGRAEDIKGFRNDKITVREIAAMQPDRLLISPGPCTPKEAGISIEAIRFFAGKLPILGDFTRRRLPPRPLRSSTTTRPASASACAARPCR